MALAAYRHILRSIPIAFKGDTRVLNGARLQARQSFEEGRKLDPASKEAVNSIQHAEDVAKFLRQNIVQGRAEGSDDQFRLRIHEETERGDNDTVKISGQKMRGKPA